MIVDMVIHFGIQLNMWIFDCSSVLNCTHSPKTSQMQNETKQNMKNNGCDKLEKKILRTVCDSCESIK